MVKKTKQTQEDSRFSRTAYDPQFVAPSSKITKIKVDARFKKMIEDPEFQSTAKVDRYGRKTTQNLHLEELKEYYDFEPDEEEQLQQDEEKQSLQEDQQIDMPNQPQDAEEDSQEAVQDNLKSWMDNYNEESSDTESLEIGQENPESQLWEEAESQHVYKGTDVQATKRIAICGYDWMELSAKDLMILLTSFKTSSGAILSVAVYMSQFGKERLQDQNRHGPRSVWSDEQIEPPKEAWRKPWAQLQKAENANDNAAFNQNKLRVYERQRLKYYYALATCDSALTADEIYRNCDGQQFENSNIEMDLRFVPDETQFSQDMLKEECKELPACGQVKNFINRAMGHSDVNLTWEDPQLGRPSNLKMKNWTKMTAEQLEKVEWGAYVNNEIEEEDEYRAAFKTSKEEKKDKEKDEEKEEPKRKRHKQKQYASQDDIEITFQSGFGSLANKPRNKNKQQEIMVKPAQPPMPETHYMLTNEQVAEKKKKKSLKEKRRQADEEKRQKKQAQLQLLIEDQDRVQSFKPDLEDRRFEAVYEKADFGINPVDTLFDHRKSGNVFAEVVKRKRRNEN